MKTEGYDDDVNTSDCHHLAVLESLPEWMNKVDKNIRYLNTAIETLLQLKPVILGILDIMESLVQKEVEGKEDNNAR
ncbi:hypothetical protein MBAV_002864 [Candidatus Magnetobacterium bavaricum]|uniref:Uncharacterized protein n=1 Tax=Candidatus Magnetobacterium bavaricum TaxID=29290 RepID=A0A0F3GSP4_9BACT|nr:hypothetical protein MBAV_002864 [Candidatus Magnetobacterium bavaricum]